MINKTLRLFISLAKLMTAEKMKLQDFLLPGEYLAYRIKLPAINYGELLNEHIDYFVFEFSCDLDKDSYSFSSVDITDSSFQEFETHLLEFLNVLFNRKNSFERDTKLLEQVSEKLHSQLTQSEKECLASHINNNTSTVLRLLGVIDHT